MNQAIGKSQEKRRKVRITWVDGGRVAAVLPPQPHPRLDLKEDLEFSSAAGRSTKRSRRGWSRGWTSKRGEDAQDSVGRDGGGAAQRTRGRGKGSTRGRRRSRSPLPLGVEAGARAGGWGWS
ncbi:hypothetical protein PR202_ga22372 [Eleusine coracana subsp. coracana]|uniref:Uncharacterized protein n=1 Tax=Eleusine coracana subsp. coracana TaxID=191504 RepID=A0AAV5D1J3_ELECO|nr:hypothetical protein PR202_ga22372 [Eleusine coracana subsp. coracana]